MTVKQFALDFYEKFFRDDMMTVASSVAFYTALSLAPLTVLILDFSGHYSAQIESKLVSQTNSIMGDEATQTISSVIDHVKSHPHTNSSMRWFEIFMVILSASLVFGQIRSALNRIFEFNPQNNNATTTRLITGFLRDKLFQMFLALFTAFAVIASIIASSLVNVGFHSDLTIVIWLGSVSASLIFYFIVFTLLLQFFPAERLPWRHAMEGGLLTSLLFVIGKEGISWYIVQSSIGAAYGAAGSMIVFLVWVYYSSLIFFIGAEVSSLLHQRNRKSAPSFLGFEIRRK